MTLPVRSCGYLRDRLELDLPHRVVNVEDYIETIVVNVGVVRQQVVADAHGRKFKIEQQSVIQQLFTGVEEGQLSPNSHHGSQGTNNKELIEELDANRYAISTNGSRFHHPDHETISRILKFGGDRLALLFNYRSDDNEIWDNGLLKTDFDYKATYPEDGEEGLTVEI